MLVVVLDFDGSWRSPRDYGFPTIPAKISTGSASISMGTGTDSSSQTLLRPVAIGSGWFHLDNDMTSTHAEYRALLLGLEYLANLDDNDDELELLYGYNSQNDDTKGHECGSLLLIQGDCKVVIDQINGKSIPRKVQQLHSRAMDLLGNLETKFGTIQAHHVPREENTLCDGLCTNLMNIIEWQALKKFAMDFNTLVTMHGLGNTTTTMANDEGASRVPLPSDQLPPSPSWLLARHFSSPTKCHIKYSSRQAIYDAIAWLSRAVGDSSTLIEVGERQAAESLLLNDKRLLARGIYNQMEGWETSNMVKKSLFLKRKHRVLLSTLEGYELERAMAAAQFSQLISNEAPIEWNDGGLEENWKDLVQRMHQAGMAMDWEKGSKLWISTTQS